MVNSPRLYDDLPLAIGRSSSSSVRIRELIAALIIALFTKPLMHAPQGIPEKPDIKVSAGDLSSSSVIVPPKIKPIPDPDAFNNRKEPPPKKNSYNPKGVEGN